MSNEFTACLREERWRWWAMFHTCVNLSYPGLHFTVILIFLKIFSLKFFFFNILENLQQSQWSKSNDHILEGLCASIKNKCHFKSFKAVELLHITIFSNFLDFLVNFGCLSFLNFFSEYSTSWSSKVWASFSCHMI